MPALKSALMGDSIVTGSGLPRIQQDDQAGYSTWIDGKTGITSGKKYLISCF
jgi:hypothetical protein